MISLFQAGDLILADKGFLLHDVLPRGVFLNVPAFLSSKGKLTKEEAIFSRKISQCRIHVERAIERLRNFRILDKISTNLRPFSSILVQVCAALVNLQTPIIKGVIKYTDDNLVNDESLIFHCLWKAYFSYVITLTLFMRGKLELSRTFIFKPSQLWKWGL